MNNLASSIVEIRGPADFDALVLDESKRRPVMVDFWAAWCGPCQMLMPILTKVAEDLGGAILLAKVNSDEQQELAARYGVRSLPTVMLFKDGRPVDQFMGAVPESEVRAFIDRHLPKETDFAYREALGLLEQGKREEARAALEANLERDSRHRDTLIELARLDLEDGRLEEAAQRLEGPLANSDDPRVAALRARLALARLAALVQDPETRLEETPNDLDARLAESARLALAGRWEEAMAGFLKVLEGHREHRDGAARTGLLATFELADDDRLVNTYRNKLARLLY